MGNRLLVVCTPDVYADRRSVEGVGDAFDAVGNVGNRLQQVDEASGVVAEGIAGGDIHALALADQMLQAARSGKQNIVEGYTDASTSYEVALKLYNIARGSLKELLEDCRDYLRTRGLAEWAIGSEQNRAMRNIGKEHDDSSFYVALAESRSDEVVANMLIVLLCQEDILLTSFIEAEGKRFLQDGGFREKLTRIRLEERAKM